MATAMLGLFVLALGVFLLPFAFPTPPPIVGRFQATVLFSPNDDGRRDVARVNVRLREPGSVSIEVERDGATVTRLFSSPRELPGWVRVTWDGTGDDGRRVADDTYALKLFVRSGEKVFDTTRKVIVDSAAPQVQRLGVTSASLAEPGRGECRVAVVARDAGSLVLEARRLGRPPALRRLGPRPLREDETVRWNWDGRNSTGERVAPGTYVVRATVFDAARNRVELRRTCWVGYLIGRTSPARPVPGQAVGVSLTGTDANPLPPSTPVTLALRRRSAVPGISEGDPLGPRVGTVARGPLGRVRVRVPRGINPAALWLVATTVDGERSALVRLGPTP